MQKYIKPTFDEEEPQSKKRMGKQKNAKVIQTLDFQDQDSTVFISFLPQDIPNSENDNEDSPKLLFLLKRLSAYYKHLLTLSFEKFWATLKYNISLRRSLDSFIKFSNKRRFNQFFTDNRQINLCHNNEMREVWAEITRTVLMIYYRIASNQKENSEKAQLFKCKDIIYDAWLIDMPKILDIVSIFGNQNRILVQTIIKLCVQQKKEYEEDFQDALSFIFSIFEGIYKDLGQIKAKDRLDITAHAKDIKNKMQLLALTQDSLCSLIDLYEFFETFQKQIIGYEKLTSLLENLFYEFISARDQDWILGPFKEEVQVHIDVILDKILVYFKLYFEHFLNYFEMKNTKNPDFSQQYYNQLAKILNAFIKDLGIVQSQGKKGLNTRVWYLPEYLGDIFNWEQFFKKIPASFDLNEQVVKLLQVNILSVLDERTRKLAKMRELLNKPVEVDEDIEGFPDFQFDEDFKTSSELQKIQQEKLKKQREEEQKQEELKSKEQQRKKDSKPLLPSLMMIKEKGVNYKQLSEQEIKEMIEKINFQQLQYEDEPDDTYDVPDISINLQEKVNSDDDADEKVKDEGELDENSKKSNSRTGTGVPRRSRGRGRYRGDHQSTRGRDRDGGYNVYQKNDDQDYDRSTYRGGKGRGRGYKEKS